LMELQKSLSGEPRMKTPHAITHMKRILLFSLALAPSLACAAGPQTFTRQLVEPVLVRNEHNTLLRLTVMAGKKPSVQVTSITV